LPLKSFRNEQRAIIVFLWAKKINANQIHSDASSIRDKCFRSEQFTFGVKRMLDGRKFVSFTDMQSVSLQWHGQQLSSFFASDIQKLLTDKTNVSANSDDMLKIKH